MMTIDDIGVRAARLADRLIPDPFVIALTLFAGSLAAGTWALSFDGAINAAALKMTSAPLLAFAFQMSLILVGGHALAEAPLFKRILARIADVPSTTSHAAMLVCFAAMVLAFLNWGLGLVGGALLARATGESFSRRRLPLNYPLLGAAGYTGLLVWHGGLSGSAPLKVASDAMFGAPISITDTIFSTMNVTVSVALLVVLPSLFYFLGRGATVSSTMPPLGDESTGRDERSDDRSDDAGVDMMADASRSNLLPAHKFDWSTSIPRWLLSTLAVATLVALALRLKSDGAAAIELNFVILLFLAVGQLGHRSPDSYQRAFNVGAAGAAGIMLQFPVYFATLGIMEASGILSSAASFVITAVDDIPVAADVSASILTFFSAAGINVLVPSGGGQWVLQAPILKETADALHISPAKLVMAFSYGDQLTNMLQPFWALPLLSITGLKAKELMGYTIVAMIVSVPLFVGALASF